MRVRGLWLAGLGALALAAPASAQIIATSIPREDVGGGTGAGQSKFAFHIMGSPFAKWNINSYVEEPKGDEVPFLVSASSTDSSSDFIGAAEIVFAASDTVSIGFGGWYNTLGEPDVDIVEIDVSGADPYVFAGTAIQKMSASEIHANVFYKSIGLQVGLVRTSATLKALRAGSEFVFLEDPDTVITLTDDLTVQDLGVPEEERSFNNWDAFLVYRYGSQPGAGMPWTVSLGAGMYRDTQASSTAFSGFATASLGIFKGLGIDASYWYVGGTSPTTAREELGDALGTTLADNLNRFTIGVGYSWPN